MYTGWTKLNWARSFGFDLTNNIVVSVDYGHMASIYSIRIIRMRKRHDEVKKKPSNFWIKIQIMVHIGVMMPVIVMKMMLFITIIYYIMFVVHQIFILWFRHFSHPLSLFGPLFCCSIFRTKFLFIAYEEWRTIIISIVVRVNFLFMFLYLKLMFLLLSFCIWTDR